MKITRYAQSCFLIETEGKRILVDPGFINYDDGLLREAWANIDAIFVTHRHRDHCHEEGLNKILENKKTMLYSTNEVKGVYPGLPVNIVKEGDVVEIGEVRVEVVHAIHGYIPKFRELNIEVNENVGYIINDGKSRFYHTSDTIGFKNDYKCDVLALPINNHGLCFGAYDASVFAKETGAIMIIPCHYDNRDVPADMDAVKKAFEEEGLNLKFVEFGNSIEI